MSALSQELASATIRALPEAANDNFRLRLVCDNGTLLRQGFGGQASIVETPGRDADYRITTLKDIGTATVYNVTYNLNAGDIPISYTDNITSANSITGMGMTATVSLQQFGTSGTGSRSFTYDNNGNRKSYTGVATSYTYNSGTNQLATIVNGSSTTTVTTNADGNITGFSPGFGSAAVTTLSYNNGQRLTSVSNASGTLGAYVYDAFGQRFSKTVGSTTTLYQYSGSALLAETTGGTETDYFYINGRPLAMLTGTTFTWLHDDHLGTPQVATNASQAVVWKASYLPFGETIATSGTATVNLRFPGQYYDAETGLNHNGFRDYVPVLGRYLETDPLGIVSTAGLYSDLNPYVYAGGTPMSLIDPWGLSWEKSPQQCAEAQNDPKRKGWFNVNCQGKASFVTHVFFNGYGGVPGFGEMLQLNMQTLYTIWAGGELGVFKAIQQLGADQSGSVPAPSNQPTNQSSYVNTTNPSANVTNITTDVSADEAATNLENNGYTVTTSADGRATTFTNANGDQYVIRPSNSAPGGQAADFTPAGQTNPTLKINFGP